MPGEWDDYSNVHVNIVPVPRHENHPDGRVSYSWDIETVNDMRPDDTAAIREITFPESMGEISVEISDPRRFRLSELSSPSSELLSGGPFAARLIDEQATPLWLINGVPRSWYPIFMDQRRERIRQLDDISQIRWMWLGILRAEPLAAVIAGREVRHSSLCSAVFDPSRQAELERAMHEMRQMLDDAMTSMAQADHGIQIGELGQLLLQGFVAADEIRQSASVNSAAYALERIFDSMYMLGREFEAASFSIAKREDAISRLDAIELRDNATADHGRIAARSRQAIAELIAFCGRPDVLAAVSR